MIRQLIQNDSVGQSSRLRLISAAIVLLILVGVTGAAERCETVVVIIPEEVTIRRAPQQVPDPAAETAIIKHFENYGFNVVDQNQVRAIRYSELVSNAIALTPEAITQLSDRFAADILVLGEAFSVVEEERGVPGQPTIQSGRARVEVRVIDADTADILAADSVHTGGIDFTAEHAGKKSLERAGDKIACRLAREMAEELSSNCFGSCDLPEITYGGMPFENSANAPINGDNLDTMVETALSQSGLTVTEPLAADMVVTGTISDWNLMMTPRVNIPILDTLIRGGVMTVEVDLHVQNLHTAEIQGDVVTSHIEGVEVFGMRFGLDPKDLARRLSNRIAERVASMAGQSLSAAFSRSPSQQQPQTTSPTLDVDRTNMGLELRLSNAPTESLRLEVYGLDGHKVYDSGTKRGRLLSWNWQNDHGQRLANGVYLYVMTGRTTDGRFYKSEVRKIVILR